MHTHTLTFYEYSTIVRNIYKGQKHPVLEVFLWGPSLSFNTTPTPGCTGQLTSYSLKPTLPMSISPCFIFFHPACCPLPGMIHHPSPNASHLKGTSQFPIVMRPFLLRELFLRANFVLASFSTNLQLWQMLTILYYDIAMTSKHPSHVTL